MNAKMKKKPVPESYYVRIGTIPQKVRKGYKFLCHNHVANDVDTTQGTRGFRAWWTNKVPDEFVPCKCGWSGLPHYARPE